MLELAAIFAGLGLLLLGICALVATSLVVWVCLLPTDKRPNTTLPDVNALLRREQSKQNT